MKAIEVDKALLFGFTGGMALYIPPTWDAFLVLFPYYIVNYSN